MEPPPENSAPLERYIETDPAALFAAYACVRDMGATDALSALLLDGPPGTGKTFLARHIARTLGAQLLRFQFFEGCGRRELISDEDFATPENPLGEGIIPKSIRLSHEGPVVLILDEIDKAQARVDGFLLNFLSEGQFNHPQIGDLEADRSNLLVVITKNDERDVSEALMRRCRPVYFRWPTLKAETEILRNAHPWLDAASCAEFLDMPHKLRTNPEVKKPPSTPEMVRLAYDLADFVRAEPDAVSVGEIYIKAIAPYPQDQRHIEKAPLFYGTMILARFKGRDCPPRSEFSASRAEGLLETLATPDE